MNIEDYLAETLREGQFDSPGKFGLALPQLLEKLANFQFPDPAHAPLALVASALSGGATALDIGVKGSQVDYRITMPEPDLCNHQGQAQPLLWALAANRAAAKRISLRCPRQGLEMVLTPNSHHLGPCRRSLESGQLLIQLQRKQPTAPEALSLPRHCGLCPIPIRLNGRLLQTCLGRAYQGWYAAWSASTPELLRPAGPAMLDTKLAVFLARSAAPNPLWVAVVGAVSYPFLLPQAGQTVGILWSQQLRTDLSLKAIVQDEFWHQCRGELIHLAAGASLACLSRMD